MKKLFPVIFVTLCFWAIFAAPKIVFAEEVKIDITKVINDSENSDEKLDEDTPKTEEEAKDQEEEKPEVSVLELTKVEAIPAIVAASEVSKVEEVKPRRRVTTTAKIIPKVQTSAPVVAPETVAAAVAPRKVIPANPAFTPNEFPKNSTLVLFSKIRPVLIVLVCIYLLASTIYLRRDAVKWKRSHWQ